MSDVMLLGVLRMPLPDDPAELDPTTWVQVRQRMREAADRIEAGGEARERACTHGSASASACEGAPAHARTSASDTEVAEFEVSLLRAALRFYANRQHLALDEDDEFDSVSGEPGNWLACGRNESTTMVENGWVAKRALQGLAVSWIENGEVAEPPPVEGEKPPGVACAMAHASAEAGRSIATLAGMVMRLVRRLRAARKGEGTAAGDEELIRQSREYLHREGLTDPLLEYLQGEALAALASEVQPAADLAERVRMLELAEEGAKVAFGHVVEAKQALELEVQRLEGLLQSAYASIRALRSNGGGS